MTSYNIYKYESNLEYPHKIVFPPSTLLAVGNNGVKIAISADEGTTWTATNNAHNLFSGVRDAVWNGRVWIAVGSSEGNVIASSLDGYTWTSRGGYNLFNSANGIDWCKERSNFLAIGQKGNNSVIATSMDGIYWRDINTGLFSAGNCDIRWNGEIWVATGIPNSTGGKSIAYSVYGNSWSYPGGNLFSIGGTRIYYINNTWTVIGTDALTNNNIATSADGINWQMSHIPNVSVYTASYELQFPLFADVDSSLIVQPTKYIYNDPTQGTAKIQPLSIAGGEGTISTLAYSENGGIEWNAIDNSPLTKCNRICWNGQIWVAVGNCIAISRDGLQWDAVNISIFTECYDVAWNGSWFVAVGYKTGSSTHIARSADGIYWSSISENVFSDRVAVIEWTGRAWLAYGSQSVSGISLDSDASTWSSKNLHLLDALTVSTLGTTSASTNTSNSGYVIDGSNSTYWESANSTYDSSGNYTGTITTTYVDTNSNIFSVSGEWIQINLSLSTIISHYFVSIFNNGNQTIPKSWVLLGSSDSGVTWHLLDSFSTSLSSATTPYTMWPLSANNQAYSSYRLVLPTTLGIPNANTVQLSEFKLFASGTVSLTAPYLIRPIVLKDYVFHPTRIIGDTRNICCVTDLCGNIMRDGVVYGKYYINSVIPGMQASVSAHTYDGYTHIACSLSGELAFLTNQASITNLNWSNQILSQSTVSSRTTIHSCCYNTRYVLLAGENGISYGAFGEEKEYPAVFYETDVSGVLSNVHCVASNSGYGHIVMQNTLCFGDNEMLTLTTPKYYSDGMCEKTQITFSATHI